MLSLLPSLLYLLYRTHGYLGMSHKTKFVETLAAAFSFPARAVTNAKAPTAAAEALHPQNAKYPHGKCSLESHVQHVLLPEESNSF